MSTRFYHNLTGHYNTFFNGNEKFKESVNTMEKGYQDDYYKILPVYKYPDKSQAGSMSGNMDIAIKKASKVIQKHTIKVEMNVEKEKKDLGKKKVKNQKKEKEKLKKKAKKEKEKEKKNKKAKLGSEEDEKPKDLKPEISPEEKEKQQNSYIAAPGVYANWIDDSYLLLGKANFYKHDLFVAMESFNYVADKYKDYETRIDGLIWSARCKVELGQYDAAKDQLELIKEEKYFPKKRKSLYAEVYADLFMKQKRYDEAIEYLEMALKYSNKSPKKARYTYILAQIYQQEGMLSKAAEFYQKVLDYNGTYELEFNAKINRALCYEGGGKEGEAIKKTLLKLLKDEKNKEYRDRINYALAEIAFKEGNEELGINYLRAAIKTSLSNNTIKSQSYLKLADYYFAKPNYEVAQGYYDSTSYLVTKDNPRYDEIIGKKNCLNELVANIKIIKLEDSLQILGRLSEGKRLQIIDNIINKIIQEEARKKEEASRPKFNAQNTGQLSQNLGGAGGTWYFYNVSTMGSGFMEFTKKWGERKLEDNWRRSNKSAVNTGEETPDLAKKDSVLQDSLKNIKTRDFYIKKIPFSPEQIQASNDRIIDAYYKVGVIYKDKLNDKPQSIDAFEKLNEKYKTNIYQLTSYYFLYLTYKSLNNQVKSDYYKNLILTNYAESDYAKLIINPNYKANNAVNKEAEFYTQTYTAYKNGDIETVISNADIALLSFKDKKILPKFLYLKAMAIGKKKDKAIYRDQLKKVSDTYPDSPEGKKALEMVNFLDGKTLGISEKAIEASTASADFSFNPASVHYFVFVFNRKSSNINKTKNEIADFNKELFETQSLKVEDLILNGMYQMIVVKSFTSDNPSKQYYNVAKLDKRFESYISQPMFSMFAISEANYGLLFKNQNIDKYNQFFKDNYLK